MGSVLSSNKSNDRNLLRIVVFGLENSGKTSMIHCLKTFKAISSRSNYSSTHGVVSMEIHSNIDKRAKFLIFDCGGCKHQRHIWPHLSNNPDLMVFVIDSTDSICWPDAKNALLDLFNDENLSRRPLLIVFSKSDRLNDDAVSKLEKRFQLASFDVNICSKTKVLIFLENFALESVDSSDIFLLGQLGWFRFRFRIFSLFQPNQSSRKRNFESNRIRSVGFEFFSDSRKSSKRNKSQMRHNRWNNSK